MSRSTATKTPTLERKRPLCPSCEQPLSELVAEDYRRCLTPGCPITATYAP